MSALDERTRDTHAEQDGKIYPTNSAYWSTWYPPNGFNCRCSFIELTEDEVNPNQVETRIVGRPDKDFSGNVGKTWLGKGAKVADPVPGINITPSGRIKKQPWDESVKDTPEFDQRKAARRVKSLKAQIAKLNAEIDTL